MDEQDLAEFETRVVLRHVKLEDFDAIVALQLECFPTMKPWLKAQFDSQLTIFPEGQRCIEIDGEIVASSASLIVDFSDYSAWDDWKSISDDGYIRNHDPAGDTLYGIELQVSPKHRGMKLARRLYEARKELCREKNLARMIVGGRIPGFVKHKDEMTAQEYVRRVISKALVDPVLTTQLSRTASSSSSWSPTTSRATRTPPATRRCSSGRTSTTSPPRIDAPGAAPSR